MLNKRPTQKLVLIQTQIYIIMILPVKQSIVYIDKNVFKTKQFYAPSTAAAYYVRNKIIGFLLPTIFQQ